MYRDYSPKGVRFYYIYKSLAHPETNGYVQPFTLQERLRHVQEARRKLGSQIPWLCDSMTNDLKHALGDAPNSEFVIAPDGKIVRLRSWSNPKQLRKDLIELVGAVEKPTQVADLKMKTLPVAIKDKDAPQGVVPRLKLTGRMQAVKVQPVLGETTFYVKLRAEADEQLMRTGKGQLYLGFLLDPLYHVHWNNLVEPLHYEVKAPAGVRVSPASAQAPKVKQPSDGDPREFLVTVEGGPGKEPIEVKVQYFACTEKNCEAVTQCYLISLERDRDGGTVSGRSGPGGGDVLARALKDIQLTEQQKGPVEKVRELHQERTRKLFQQMRDGKLDLENMPAIRRELQELLMKEMKWILNEEQYKKFAQAMKNDRPGGFGGWPRNGDRPPSAPSEAAPAPTARPKP